MRDSPTTRPIGIDPIQPMPAAGRATRASVGWRPRWLRALGRRRRLRVVLTLLLPLIGVVLIDAAMRGGRLLTLPGRYYGSYLFAMLEGGLLWALLLAAASARKGRARWLAAIAFMLLMGVALGGQIYFYRQYSIYLNLDATLFGTSMGDSLGGQLSADGQNLLSCVLPLMGAALLLVWVGRRLVRTPRRLARWLAFASPLVLLATLAIPCSYRSIQGSTPDVIYFHAVGGLIKQLTGIDARQHVRPMRRTPPRLDPLQAAPSRPRNVLFVLTESIRADVSCSAYTRDCPWMPASNAALPERLPLLQMRSNSSTTAIQLAVLWSGLPPNAGRQPLHQAPLLFDYAHAAGWDTAYWSSHHMMFANSRLFVEDLPTHFQCGATHLDPLADVDIGADDRLLTARVKEQLAELREPFFAVVHYGNTHVPYLVDEADAPFQPALASKAPEDNEAYRNYYKNAVVRQDRAVAELLEHVRGQAFSERTVIVYTSDHGEQFREHGQLGHTGSVFDVEVHVPAWIDAPAGSLSEAERQAWLSYRERPVFHTDMTPTLLDLMGLWEAPQLAGYRDKMPGGSLLRPDRPETTLALTNCSGVWGCAFENFGVMRGRRKLLAREWDAGWLCYDTEADPAELSPLPLAGCGDLVEQAQAIYPHLPGKE